MSRFNFLEFKNKITFETGVKNPIVGIQLKRDAYLALASIVTKDMVVSNYDSPINLDSGFKIYGITIKPER